MEELQTGKKSTYLNRVIDLGKVLTLQMHVTLISSAQPYCPSQNIKS
jgi:hypothetical protein